MRAFSMRLLKKTQDWSEIGQVRPQNTPCLAGPGVRVVLTKCYKPCQPHTHTYTEYGHMHFIESC